MSPTVEGRACYPSHVPQAGRDCGPGWRGSLRRDTSTPPHCSPAARRRWTSTGLARDICCCIRLMGSGSATRRCRGDLVGAPRGCLAGSPSISRSCVSARARRWARRVKPHACRRRSDGPTVQAASEPTTTTPRQAIRRTPMRAKLRPMSAAPWGRPIPL